MKLMTTITALAATASASPYAAVKRAGPQELQIRSLSGGCVPHGTGCSIGFQVKTAAQTAWTTCAQHFATAVSEIPEQPFFDDGCSDDDVIWSYRIIGRTPRRYNAFNYTLIVAYTTRGVAASKIWPSEQWPVLNDGVSSWQRYVGPSEFVMRSV